MTTIKLRDMSEGVTQASLDILDFMIKNPIPQKVDDIYSYMMEKGHSRVTSVRALLTLTRNVEIEFVDLLETVALVK